MSRKHILLVALAVVAVGCGASAEPTKTEEANFRNPQRTMPAGAGPTGAPPTTAPTGG